MTSLESLVADKTALVLELMKVDPDDKYGSLENKLAVKNLIEAVTQQAVHDHLQRVVSLQKFVVPDGPVKFIRRPGLLFPDIKGKGRRSIPGLLFDVIKKGHEVIDMIRKQEDGSNEECFYLEDALDAFDEIYFNQENP